MLQAMMQEVCAEFGLYSGQMRSDVKGLPFAKNQWWFLDEVEIGYGDLSQDDVIRIAERLAPGRTFTAFDEYVGMRARDEDITPFETTSLPRMIITCDDIKFPRGKPRGY